MKPSSLLCIAAGILASTASAKDGYYGNIASGYIGCYGSAGESIKFAMKDLFQTASLCRNFCRKEKKMKYAAVTEADQCWCGNSLPGDDKKLDESKCQEHCPGWPQEPCGSKSGDFTILTADPNDTDPKGAGTGGSEEEENDDDNGDVEVAPTSTKPLAVSTVFQDGKTIFYTVPAETNGASDEEKINSSLNKAGVAAGVVVGVLAAASIGVGAFIFARKQKRRRVEEEYRRSVAILEYGAKKPESDVRLDPVMLQRRMSDGSIADNQDYSRRILKVTNPDGN